jgi:hypothetical protein
VMTNSCPPQARGSTRASCSHRSDSHPVPVEAPQARGWKKFKEMGPAGSHTRAKHPTMRTFTRLLVETTPF